MSQTKIDLTDPALFSHWADDTIRFGDMDSTGHVNNVAFARYVEGGRVPFMQSGVVPRYDDKQRFVVGSLSIRFRVQAYFPGTVRIGTAVIGIGNKTITLGHAVFSEDVCLVTAETIMVYIRDGRGVELGEEMRAGLAQILVGV